MRKHIAPRLLLIASLASPSVAGEAWFPPKDMMTVGVYYYPEAWPKEQWPRDLANIKKLGFEFVHMGEFAWAFMEPEEGRFDFGWLEENVRLAAAQGLKVVLCTPSATPPAWLVRRSNPWSAWAELLTPAAGTRVLARYGDQFYEGEAAVVTRALGRGTVTYVGVETETHDLEREVVRRVMTEAGVTVEDHPDLLFVDWRDGFWIASNFSSTDQEAPIPEGATPIVGSRRLKPAEVAIWP